MIMHRNANFCFKRKLLPWMRVIAMRYKLTGQGLGRAGYHFPDQYKNHGVVMAFGA